MTTLEEYCEDEDFLRKCLGPTVTSAACDTARSSHQDSLLRLLLQVPDMQPRLLTLLLERMAEIADISGYARIMFSSTATKTWVHPVIKSYLTNFEALIMTFWFILLCKEDNWTNHPYKCHY